MRAFFTQVPHLETHRITTRMHNGDLSDQWPVAARQGRAAAIGVVFLPGDAVEPVVSNNTDIPEQEFPREQQTTVTQAIEVITQLILNRDPQGPG